MTYNVAWIVDTSQMKLKLPFNSQRVCLWNFFKILDVNQTWYMYMWWWKSADILHEHKLSTPHGPYWRFTDYVIWLIKIYFYKGYKTIYYKLWEKSAFHASSPCGPNTCNSSCPVKLSNFFTLITWASRSTLDSLSVHFKEQKETCIVHGSLRFFNDIIHWAGGFNTD